MCGRYSITSPEEAVRAVFGYTSPPLNLRPNYNVAPTHDVPVVRNREGGGGREMVQMRWGLIPFWAKDTKIAFSTINARVETVQTSGTYRNAFKSRRCLVVADGFYEWKKLDPKGKEKQPYRITLKSGAPFGFAGLWETWGKGADAVVSCTIITGPPNELVAKIHDRMAVILPPEHWDAWLSGSAGVEVLTPYPAKLMRAYKVDRRVGNVKNNDVKLLEEVT